MDKLENYGQIIQEILVDYQQWATDAIERCWAALENYWNGTVLDSIQAAIYWAMNITWKGIAPIIHLLDTLYEKGIKVPLLELEDSYFPFWQRSETLPKWDITIAPT